MMTDTHPADDPQVVTAPGTGPGEHPDPDFEIEVGGGPVDTGDPVQTSPPPK